MEIAKNKLDLIQKVIRNDRRYSGNEDLYEDFYNETCKRSLGIINAISVETTLELYLRKVATTSIINVLKDSGRLRRTSSGFTPTRELSLEAVNTSNKYSDIEVSYSNFKIDETPETVMVKNDILTNIYGTVVAIDESDSKKQYLQIYKLRYDKGMTQKEISEELGLSQSEVSKRLFQLMEKVKKSLN